jgi:myosin heavy subunit
MKSAVLSDASTILSSDSPNLYVSESAQRRLDALRSSVEVRLAALEAALADPNSGESLETLILDLARVACEESQAAATQACADTRLEAEVNIARARSTAQAALDQEVAAGAEMRGQLEEAELQILALQQDKEDGLNRVRTTFEADLSKERAARSESERAASKLERAFEDVKGDLNTERGLTKQLRQELDRAEDQLRAIKDEHSDASSLRQRLEKELARVREVHEETESQLTRERNTVSELRRASEKAAEQLTVLGRRESDARSAHEQITKVYDETVAELRHERDAYAELRNAYAKVQSQVEANKSAGAEVERVREALQQRLSAEQATAADLKRSLASLQEQFDAERENTAELRRATAQAEARMQTAVEAEHELRAQLAEATSHGKQKANASDADAARAAAAAKQVAILTTDLEAERRTVTDLRLAKSESEARWEKERRALAQQSEDQIASLTSKLEKEQQRTADLRRTESDLEARLSAEQTASAELRQNIQHAQDRGQAGNQDIQGVREALALARSEVQSLRDELEKARGRVETALGERADLERLLQESETRLKRAVRDREELEAKSQGGQPSAAHHSAKSASDTTKTAQATAPLNVLPAPAAKPSHKPGKPVARLNDDPNWVAVRMSPRYSFSEPISVQINGTPSQLSDLSVGGCQVLSQNALKPNQTVKVVLPTSPKPLNCSGKIVWAKLEAPALGRPAGYRAGVQFTKPDQAAIDAFIISHRATVNV